MSAEREYKEQPVLRCVKSEKRFARATKSKNNGILNENTKISTAATVTENA